MKMREKMIKEGKHTNMVVVEIGCGTWWWWWWRDLVRGGGVIWYVVVVLAQCKVVATVYGM